MGRFLKEFKEFAVRGNAVDMAVGGIIGLFLNHLISHLRLDRGTQGQLRYTCNQLFLFTGESSGEEAKEK